jgi:hypothetical protein
MFTVRVVVLLAQDVNDGVPALASTVVSLSIVMIANGAVVNPRSLNVRINFALAAVLADPAVILTVNLVSWPATEVMAALVPQLPPEKAKSVVARVEPPEPYNLRVTVSLKVAMVPVWLAVMLPLRVVAPPPVWVRVPATLVLPPIAAVLDVVKDVTEVAPPVTVAPAVEVSPAAVVGPKL